PIGLNGLARVSLIKPENQIVHDATMILSDDAARCLFASSVAAMHCAEPEVEKQRCRDLVAFSWRAEVIEVLGHRGAVLPDKTQREYRLQGEAIVELIFIPGKDGSKDKVIEVLLTNFRVQIVSDVLLDDGFEPMRRMRLASSLNGVKREFEIDANEFTRPRVWAVRNVGAGARIFPNASDRDVCDAVQAVSSGVPTTTIFKQTGWRE